MPPLVIFPEGTTSNGEYLLTFKKGAFHPMRPVKIVCLKYETSGFYPYSSLLPFNSFYILCMSSWSLKVKIYEFEGVYDPKHLNIDPNNKEGWKIFAEKVRNIMAKCLKVQKVELGHKD